MEQWGLLEEEINFLLLQPLKSFMKKIILLSFLTCILSIISFGQNIKSALFLGNSYTSVNNLPLIVSTMAHSTGDSVYYDSNTPGGYTLQQHSADVTSLGKINAGGWDYVVLQEQSQLPSFPISQVQVEVFPYAHFLDSAFNAGNLCGETMFYMTWGRKNGDATNCGTWPPVCTYSGMDSLLHMRYMMMASDIHAVVSPVGAVWKYIRQNFPLIELYQSDESHPTLAGSYAAACCFYTAMFRKNPLLIANDYTLPASDAANIRMTAKLIVFDSLLNWHIEEYDPVADFTSATSANNTVTFTNLSNNATDYIWDFGDGDTTSVESPVHTYASSGVYTVTLIVHHCNISDTSYQTVNATLSGIENSSQQVYVLYYPNPVNDELNVFVPNGNVQKVAIIDYVGQTYTARYNVDGNKIRLDFSRFTPGIYFAKITADGKVWKVNVVKE
jgi:hypothetical protein